MDKLIRGQDYNTKIDVNNIKVYNAIPIDLGILDNNIFTVIIDEKN